MNDTIRFVNSADGAELYLYDCIGFWGVNPDEFRRQLGALESKPLTLRINSPGGSISDGMAIYSLLRDYKGEVTVKIDGIAASMASVIATVGKRVLISEGGVIMVHMPLVQGVAGNSEELRKLAADLEAFVPGLVSAYTARTGKPEAEVRGWMESERYFSAKDALENGLVDEIIKNPKASAVDAQGMYRMSFLNQFKNAGVAERILTEAGIEFSPEALSSLVSDAKAGREAKAILERAAGEIEAATKRATDAEAAIVTAKAGLDAQFEAARTELEAAIEARVSAKAAELVAANGLPSPLSSSPADDAKLTKQELWKQFNGLSGSERAKFWAKHEKDMLG